MYGPGLFSPVTLGGVVLNILCSQSCDLELVQICTCGNTNIIVIFVWSVHQKNSVFLVSAVCSESEWEFWFFCCCCFCPTVFVLFFVWMSVAVIICFVLHYKYKSLTVADGGHFLLGRGGSVVHPPRRVNAPTEPGRQGTRVWWNLCWWSWTWAAGSQTSPYNHQRFVSLSLSFESSLRVNSTNCYLY